MHESAEQYVRIKTKEDCDGFNVSIEAIKKYMKDAFIAGYIASNSQPLTDRPSCRINSDFKPANNPVQLIAQGYPSN